MSVRARMSERKKDKKIKSTIRKNNEKNISHNYVYLISTLAAEVTSCFVRLPFEIVKQRMQVDTTNNSMMNFVSEVTGDNNLKSFLFRSYVITLLREIPFNCIEFFLWENFQKSAKRKFTNFANKYPSVTSAFCGGVAAAISGFLTTPIDVVKSRQMIYGRSFQETISEMYDEGIGSFYRGWYFRSTYLFMGGIVFFGSLNLMSRCLRTNTQVEKT